MAPEKYNNCVFPYLRHACTWSKGLQMQPVQENNQTKGDTVYDKATKMNVSGVKDLFLDKTEADVICNGCVLMFYDKKGTLFI